MTEKKEATVGGKTKVRMELLIPLLCTLVTSAFSCGVLYSKLSTMETKMDRMWTIQDQVVWARQLAADNPGIKVPAPEGIVELMDKRGSP